MSAPVNKHPNQFGIPVATTDATQTASATFPTKSNRVYMAIARVAGALTTDFSQGGAYQRTALFKNAAGTLSLIGSVSAPVTIESDAAWDVTLDASGTDIRVLVTGKAATAITWLTQLDIIEVGNYFANYGMAEPS